MATEIQEIKYVVTLDSKQFESDLESLTKTSSSIMENLGTFNTISMSIKNLNSLGNTWKTATSVVSEYSNAISKAGAQNASLLLASSMKGYEVIVGVVTGKVTLLTAAQTALSAAMAAAPFLIVIAAVAALGYSIYDHMKKEEEAKAKKEAFIKTLEDEKKAFEDAINSQRESTASEIESLGNTQKYIDELENLVDTEGNIIGNKEYVKKLIDEINGVMPGSISLLEDETVQWNESTEAIKKNIEAKQAEKALELFGEEAIAARKAVNESIEQQKVHLEEIKRLEEEIKEIESREAEGDTQVQQKQLDIEEKRKLIEEQKMLLQQEQDMTLENAYIIDNYERMKNAYIEGNYDEMERIMAQANLKLKNASAMTDEELKAGIGEVQRTITMILQEYGDNIPPAIQEYLDGLTGAISSYREELDKRGYETGTALSEGTARGIKNGSGSVSSAFRGIVYSAVEEGRRAAQVNSPSKLTMHVIGEPLSEGIAVGIENNEDMVANALVSISENAIEEAKKKATSYKEIGTLYLSNLKTGMDERTNATISAAEALVSAQVKAMEESVNKELENFKGTEEAKKEREKLAKEQTDVYKKLADETMSTYKKALEAGADKAYEVVSERISAITEEAQAQYDEIIRDQESMMNKLTSFGDLFDYDDDGNMVLGNLDEDIKTLEEYDRLLTKIKDENVSDEFMQQITNLGVEEGISFASQLLGLSEKDFDTFVGKWEEKQEKAKKISQDFYEEDLLDLEENFEKELELALEEVPERGRQVAVDTIEGVIAGLSEKGEDAIAEARRIADAIIAEMQRALDVNSPSKKAMKMVGAPIMEGVQLGMEKAYDKEKLRELSDTMLADVGYAQAMAANSVQQQYNSVSSSSVTNNEGSLIFNFDKMVNSGTGSATSFMKEMELIRRKRASAVGG